MSPMWFVRSPIAAFAVVIAFFGVPAHAQDLSDARRIKIGKALRESSAAVVAGPSTGSGFVVGPERWVVTNAHVVSSWAGPVVVRFGNGSASECRVLVSDRIHDLAVLEPLERLSAKPLRLADSNRVEVGQTVLAFGSPFGLEGTLTQGIVSARRELPSESGGTRSVIQTDAPINPGNSGGPLVNVRGEVIGVNASIFSRTGGNEGIAFAIPINEVKSLLSLVRSDLRKRRELAAEVARLHPTEILDEDPTPDSGRTEPGPVSLGVVGQDFRGQGYAGVVIRRVERGSPAAEAGLLGQGDEPPPFVRQLGVPWTGHIILEVDGRAVRSMAELQAYLRRKRPGDEILLGLTIGPGIASGEARVRLRASGR